MRSRISSGKLKMNREELKNAVIKQRKKYYHKLPGYISKSFQVDELVESGCRCYRLLPDSFNGTYIVYLYGNGLSLNITRSHWDFITALAERTGTGLFVPMYPLAPENCCRDVFNMLTKAYSNFAMGRDISRIILLGDSSGAGLALSLSLIAWKEGLRIPDQLIMLSPAIDTEFFDKELEKAALEAAVNENKFYFSDGAKDFINTYWVKDYAVKTDYTSPYYGDYMDLGTDIVLFSGTQDMFNSYSRAFYNRIKQSSSSIRFFEYENECHDFMIFSKSKKSREAFEYLVDTINKTYEASLPDIFQVKKIADWTEKYPDVIKDDWACDFIKDNNFDFKCMKKYGKLSRYKDMLLAASYAACDKMVEKFILEFPNGTIVNIGCRLDNMFQRVDNGRIQWYSVDTHNIMSVRRAMYGKTEREITVGRSLTEFSWLDEIQCERGKGIMFVCNDAFSYLHKNKVRELIAGIWERFPGAELVFTSQTSDAGIYNNFRYIKNIFTPASRIFSVNDAYKMFTNWRTDYRIISEEPIMKYMPKKKCGLKTKLAASYNMISYNHKIIHVRLGNEAYETNY